MKFSFYKKIVNLVYENFDPALSANLIKPTNHTLTRTNTCTDFEMQYMTVATVSTLFFTPQ